MRHWWPILGGVVGGAIGWAISWALAGNDIGQLGDWRHGALRFIGLVRRVTRGVAVSRDGFTLSYRPLEPARMLTAGLAERPRAAR